MLLSAKNKTYETPTNRNMDTTFLDPETMSPKLTGAAIQVDHVFPVLMGRHNWHLPSLLAEACKCSEGSVNSETHTDVSLPVCELGDRILLLRSSIPSGKT